MKRYYDNAKEILPTTKPDSDLSTVPEEDEEDETDNIAAKLQGKSKILLLQQKNLVFLFESNTQRDAKQY